MVPLIVVSSIVTGAIVGSALLPVGWLAATLGAVLAANLVAISVAGWSVWAKRVRQAPRVAVEHIPYGVVWC